MKNKMFKVKALVDLSDRTKSVFHRTYLVVAESPLEARRLLKSQQPAAKVTRTSFVKDEPAVLGYIEG